MTTRPVRKQLDHTPHTVARFGADFFITICCGKRNVNQLCTKEAGGVILDTARIYHDSGRWQLHLMLLMPDHLHALICIPGEAEMSGLVRDFKRITTRKAGVKWQRNYFDHRLRHDESLREKEDYILQNPVRAGLIAKPEEWPYKLFGDARGTWS
jgi:putative transposase